MARFFDAEKEIDTRPLLESSKSGEFPDGIISDLTDSRPASPAHSTSDRESDTVPNGKASVKGEENQPINFFSLPRKSKTLLLLCCVANFACCLSYAVPSPFFPEEADSKGMSSIMVGVFFSIYEVVVFLTSPVFGLYMKKIGPRFLLLAGIFMAGTSSIIFGVISRCPPGISFQILSLITRAQIALGYSAFVTSMQVTVLNELPSNEGIAFSLMEGSAGVGFMVGPAVGGVLFEFGGFGVPFYVIGATVTLCGIMLIFTMPPVSEKEDIKQPSVFTVLLHPMVWVTLTCIMVCSIGMGFLDPTLAKHLEPFDLSAGIVGLFFVIVSLIYCLSTPLWGYVIDNNKIGLGPLLTAGGVICGIGFLIIGPSPWLGFIPYAIWTVIISLVFIGFSQPSGMIATIKCLTTAATESGLEDNIETYGMLVGIYNCAYCLGATVGPLMAGVLVDAYGFPTGYTIVAVCNFVLAAICIMYFLLRMRTKNALLKAEDAGKAPLFKNGYIKVPSEETDPSPGLENVHKIPNGDFPTQKHESNYLAPESSFVSFSDTFSTSDSSLNITTSGASVTATPAVSISTSHNYLITNHSPNHSSNYSSACLTTTNQSSCTKIIPPISSDSSDFLPNSPTDLETNNNPPDSNPGNHMLESDYSPSFTNPPNTFSFKSHSTTTSTIIQRHTNTNTSIDCSYTNPR